MKIKKQALLYDIANLAFVIADTGNTGNHGLHRVTDICEDGNRDRVARMLGMAYAAVLAVLAPIAEPPALSPDHDYTRRLHDYEIRFRKHCGGGGEKVLSPAKKLRIKTLAHEYMVCATLADWLAFTFPEAAPVWKEKARGCLEALAETVAFTVTSFRRRVSPI